MAAPDPSAEWFSGLPAGVQVGLTIATGIAGWLAYHFGYRRAPPEPKPPTTDVQVVSGAFADRQALKELAMQIERLADLIEKQVEARDEEARESRMIDRMMDELKKLENEKRRG